MTAPVLLTDREDDAITVRWTWGGDLMGVAITGGADITAFELQVWDSANGRWMHQYTAADYETSYEHEDLAPMTTYYYALRARNSVGAGPWSDSQIGDD